jgi:hypothetical protein
MKETISYFYRVTLMTVALSLLTISIPFVHSVTAQSMTGLIEYSTDNSTYSTASSIGSDQGSSLWFRWSAQNTTDCILWMDNVETNKIVVGVGTSATTQISTAAAGSFHYSYRCDDPAVTGTTYVQVAWVNVIVTATPTSNTPPSTPTVWEQDPDCVIGLSNRFTVSTTDANNDSLQIYFSRDYTSKSGQQIFPTATTHYAAGGSQVIDYVTTHGSNNFPTPEQMSAIGETGVYVGFDAKAVDNQGNSSPWMQDDVSTQNNNLRNRLCVYNLDQGMPGGDSDGTDLIVRTNGGPWTAAGSIDINTGDQLEFRWLSALDNCTSYSGPGMLLYGRAGTDTDVTEPGPGESYTFNLHCNTVGFSQSENIVVTNVSSAIDVCTGSVPAGASAYDQEESSELTSGLAWAYSASDTVRKCQFKCDSGSWNGSSCTGVTLPTGVTVTLGSTENGAYAQGDRNISTQSNLGINWASTNADVCYYSWWGVFRGSYITSGEAYTVSASGGVSLGPPPRNINDYFNVQVTCLDSTRTQAADQIIKITTASYGNPPPIPSANLQASKYANGSWGPWTSDNLTISSGEQVRMRWSSTNVYSCAATEGAGFSTYAGYDYSGNYTGNSTANSNGSDPEVEEPSAGQATTYSIDCDGDLGAVTDSLTVTNNTPNTPPPAPTITGPTNGYNQISYSFTISGTDPDNQSVRYAIDWDNNGTIDAYSSYGASGWQYQRSYSWNTIGSKTFCVRTDDGAALSAKTCHTITLATLPPPSIDVKVNGNDGPINIRRGDALTVSWDIDFYSGSCTLYGAEVNPSSWWWNSGQRSVSGSGSLDIDTTDSAFSSISSEDYFLQCGSYDDTATVNLISQYLTFELRDNGGPWSMNSMMVQPGSPLELHWNYTHPQRTNCSSLSSNFSTSGGQTKSPNFDSNGGVAVSPPTLAAGAFATYTIRCNTWSGYTTASITATAYRPNFTTPIIATPSFGTYNTTTGTYASTTLTFRTENDGEGSTAGTADYRFRFDINRDGDYNDAGESVIRNNYLEMLSPNTGTNKSETFVGSIAPGNHDVSVTVDYGNEVIESNEGDNTFTGTINIPQPEPALTIGADKTRVGSGETTTIRWSVPGAAGTLTCQVYGPGLNLTTVSLPGSSLVGPITAKSEYTLKCTDTSTGSVWLRSVIIETVGTIEEI